MFEYGGMDLFVKLRDRVRVTTTPPQIHPTRDITFKHEGGRLVIIHDLSMAMLIITITNLDIHEHFGEVLVNSNRQNFLIRVPVLLFSISAQWANPG